METALSVSFWCLTQVINKLSDQLVADYVSSSELGLNFQKIKTDLLHTQGLLHEAQQRDTGNNPALQSLMQQLKNKADDAEDALDELHYFKIQDELDGTRDADLDLGDGLGSQALHARHVFRHNIGNWFPCFTCCRSQDAATGNTDKAKPQNDDTAGHAEELPKSDSCSDEHAEKLPFDRVAMSNKIKQLIEELHSLCEPINKLLPTIPSNNRPTGTIPERPITSATITPNSKFCGRDAIFEKTIGDLTGGTYSKTLSVLPILGPGGIGKTTFTQHLYNDKRIIDFFPVRIWVCVSKNFEVANLTQEIYSCIPASQNEDINQANNTTNLTLLQESIAQRLKSQRFLLVLDDIWECKKRDWETLLAPFGKGETKGNMVLVTTRMPKIATNVKIEEINPINLRGLEPDEFWKFFKDCVFGEIKDEQDKDYWIAIARAISDKLKCSPLAAKTVGSLLRNNKTPEYWSEILNKKKWENLDSDDDNIMPALNISYDYLPVQLKECFSYCALFPEDHRFRIQELTHFWDAIGIIDTSSQSAEDLVNGLVDYGFLIKQDDDYMLHDLLHELAQQVSSQECVNISFNGFTADNVAPSVRHVSVTLDKKYSENIGEEMKKLKGRIDIGNLRTLMIFGYHKNHKNPVSEYYMSTTYHNILKDTFNEIKDLRVLYIFMPRLESLPYNVSKLIHLRYLEIKTRMPVSLPGAISRLYHLKFLILKKVIGGSIRDVPKDFNRLVNLRHVQTSNEFHSSIPGVGKMECLEVLNEFHVKKQSVGFELAELGKLTKLTGELRILGLEQVKTKKEAEEALLKDKSKLRTLSLEFSTTEQTTGHDAIEGLRPHPNLEQLTISGHSGVTGPSWLCLNICIKSLKSLCLSNISWDVLPPFGRLPLLENLMLKEIHGLRQFRLDSDGVVGSLKHFKKISIYDMPDLVKWIGGDNSHLFSKLESIDLGHCPNITTLPFSDCNGLSTEGTDMWFPHLRSLCIDSCPKLSHLPPMPYTSTLTSVLVWDSQAGSTLSYGDTDLTVQKYSGALAFDNIGEVKRMRIEDALHLLTDLHKLSSPRELVVTGDMFSGEVDDGVVIPSVQKVFLESFHPTGKLLSNVFKCFPALSELEMNKPNNDQGEIILQFPPSRLLLKIQMIDCENLILSAEGGGAFGGLTSLQSLSIRYRNPKIFSQWSLAEASRAVNPLPASITDLELFGVRDKISMALLSNLTSITSLRLTCCDNLTAHGFNPLISRSLKQLRILQCGSVAADLLALPEASWQLEDLWVDNISAVLVNPICRRLSATLCSLGFCDKTIERFTEEQGKALQLFTALEELSFYDCKSLQSLPEGINRLCSLKRLMIGHKIQSLPKCGLPTSLEFLLVVPRSVEFVKELEDLRETRPDLEIDYHYFCW